MKKKDNLFSKVFISAFFSYTCVEKNLLSGAGTGADQDWTSSTTVTTLLIIYLLMYFIYQQIKGGRMAMYR